VPDVGKGARREQSPIPDMMTKVYSRSNIDEVSGVFRDGSGPCVAGWLHNKRRHSSLLCCSAALESRVSSLDGQSDASGSGQGQDQGQGQGGIANEQMGEKNSAKELMRTGLWPSLVASSCR